MLYFASEKLGPHSSRTPEGYLLYEGTPISRIGVMLYGPGETEIKPGRDGVVRITRLPEDVFAPESIASFNGKSVVNDHPDDLVSPKDWRQLTCGTVLNPRRGLGIMDNFLVADLLITDAEAIDAVLSGKREVSCGYSAEYEETGEGAGRQYNIFGNHVALVDSGRCGSQCSIKDHKMAAKPKTKQSVRDRILKAFATRDEAELESAMDDLTTPENPAGGEPKSEGTHVHIHMGEPSNTTKPEGGLPGTGEARTEGAVAGAGGEGGKGEGMDEEPGDLPARCAALEKSHGEMKAMHDAMNERLTNIEGMLKAREEKPAEGTGDNTGIEGEMKAEAPPGTGDEMLKMAKDSAYFADSFTQTLAAAEILAPGIELPKYQRDAAPKATYDAICKLRRAALAAASVAPHARDVVQKLAGVTLDDGQALDVPSMSCAAVRSMFLQASRFVADANRARASTFDVAIAAMSARHEGAVAPTKIADVNARNAEFWAKQTATV